MFFVRNFDLLFSYPSLVCRRRHRPRRRRRFLLIVLTSFTVFFIHDGISWRDVRALEAAVRDLTGVTSLTAAADLDIGDFALK